MSKEATRFKQTGIGELPEGWEVKKLSEIAIIKQGGKLGLTKKDYVSEGYPAFSATGQDGFVSVYEYEGEAIILSSIGAQCGKCFYATGKWTTLANTQIIFVNPKIANTLFIFYQVNRPNFWIRSGSAQPFIHPSDVKNAKVVIPPLEEQKKIVGVLRLVDRVAEETKRIINIYERAKKFALKYLLTKGIGHTRFKQTEIGELPEEWEVVRLGEVCKTASGGTPNRKEHKFFGGGIPWVKSSELKDTVILETEETLSEEGLKHSSAKIFPKGTVVVAMYGATVGRTGILGIDAATNQACCAFFPNPNLLDKMFLFFWLQYVRPVLARQSVGAAQPNISQQILRQLPIPLPPLEEQKQIAEMLSPIDAAIENERRYLGILEKCKKWMLDNLLTGKVRLPPEVDEILKGVLPDAF